ncbi:glycerophosphodiester phosphodiesterase family protein [Winogradskyella sp. HB-48]|uniref:glycerophosphodiester phosphodiesterase family protein n=1 Tax=Winogradskyella sp. HB-48 TaxID=3416808 RepID=UPI003CF99699
MKRLLLFILVIGFVGCKNSKPEGQSEQVQKSKLIELFKSTRSDYPNISVHRGGKGIENYPENCLETLKYVGDSISAIFEIDVAQTKDGKLVLMHDNSIDRTTTGSGLLKTLTYNELSSYNLVDDYGNQTKYKIPLFSEVLKWSRENNVILTIDIKRSVSQEDVVKVIKAANAKDISIIITYDIEQAESAYKLAPDLLLSVSARNHEEFDGLLKTEIPTENMLAFTGTRLSDKSLYQRLHNEDIVCILGTLGNLDKQAEARGDELYLRWKNLGADILATDRPFEVNKAINH